MFIQFLKRSFKIIVLIVSTVLLLTLTNPNHMASVFLVAPFLLFALVIYQAAMAIFRYSNDTRLDQDSKAHIIRPRLIAALAAGFPVLLLILQSIGQLSLKDVITVTAIIVLAYFYMGKFSSKAQMQ